MPISRSSLLRGREGRCESAERESARLVHERFSARSRGSLDVESSLCTRSLLLSGCTRLDDDEMRMRWLASSERDEVQQGALLQERERRDGLVAREEEHGQEAEVLKQAAGVQGRASGSAARRQVQSEREGERRDGPALALGRVARRVAGDVGEATCTTSRALSSVTVLSSGRQRTGRSETRTHRRARLRRRRQRSAGGRGRCGRACRARGRVSLARASLQREGEQRRARGGRWGGSGRAVEERERGQLCDTS